MTGIELIAQERQEQIEKHQRSIKNDIFLHKNGELVEAAVGLIIADEYFSEEDKDNLAPEEWHYETWKHMVNKSYVGRLEIAGALIAAEIDRILNIEQDESLPK